MERMVEVIDRCLPDGWCTLQLQDVVESFKRGPFGSAIKKSFFVHEGYKVYQQQNAIYDDPVLGSYFVDEQKYEELSGFKVKPRDFIVSCSGTIGKISRLPQDTKHGIINQALLRIELNEDIFNSDLFLYLFRSHCFQKLILKETRGSAMKNIAGVKDLKLVPINLPPLREQSKILDKIEELLSDLNDGIKSLKTAQQQLKVYRQAVLKWAFEGKLTAKWREEQRRLSKLESADALLEKIKEERSRKYQKALKDWEEAVEFWNTNEREGKKPSKPKAIKILDPLNEEELASSASLPQEWLWEKLGHLSEIVGGVTKGRKLEGKTTIPFPYLRVANVQDGYLDLSVVKYIDVLPGDLAKYRLEYGDILYTEGGDRDKLGRGTIWKDEIKDCIHQNHIFRARVPEQNISSLFITYFSQSSVAKDYFFKHAKQTVNLASINLRILSNFPVPVPSTAEQMEIVKEIEAKFSICDRLQSDITTNLKKAEALRQSILKQAFEGKLVPQNSNDEPASDFARAYLR